MKIVLANKFFYPRGGDCIHTIELEKLLVREGHEIAVFSMQHPSNNPSQWAKYFPREVDYGQRKGGLWELITRPLGSHHVKKKFEQLLDSFHPDIVHLNNIHTQLSPIIAQIASQRGIKVVWTLHDMKLLCPRYDCLRNDTLICEACVEDPFNVVRYSCMKNSRIASWLAYLEAKKWTPDKLIKYTSKFICPSTFLKSKMERIISDSNKLTVLHNFIDEQKVTTPTKRIHADYFCYVGRISLEKGLRTLLEASKTLPYKLKIIGGGPLLNELKARYQSDQIIFIGYQNWEAIKETVSAARFLVIPSEWYENNPLTVLESLSLGTPVLGARIGGIPELIDDGENGMLFTPGDIDDLTAKIKQLYTPEVYYNYNHDKIAMNAQRSYSSKTYYDNLLTIYQE